MRYDEAFKIGSECDGYIRCSYAELHNPEYGKLFSLQKSIYRKSDAQDDVNAALQGIGTKIKEGGDVLETNIQFDIPLVYADTYVPDEKWVPVRLTPDAIEYLVQIIKAKDKHTTKWRTVYRIYKCSYKYDNTKEYIHRELYRTQFVKPEYDLKEFWPKEALNSPLAQGNDYWYEFEEAKEQVTSYQGLIDCLRNGKEFYVKHVAIDWIPTNIENVTVTDEEGVEIYLEDALAEAESKMNQAKALLGVAAASNVVL